MREAITVATSTGVTGKLSRATLDTKNQTLRSHSPVAFDMVSGTVRAKAMTLHSSEHTLLFRGGVRVHVNKTAKPAPAAGAGRVIRAAGSGAGEPRGRPAHCGRDARRGGDAPMSARAVYCMLLASAFTALGLAPAAAQTAPDSPPAAADRDTAPAPRPHAAQTAAAPAAAAATGAATGAFGAFSKNSNQPIDIESDTLVVHDREQYATFMGNVKAVQGTTTLRSKELKVHYVGGAADSLTGAGPKPAAAAAPAAAPSAAPPAAGEQVASATPKPAGAGALGDAGNQISKIEARGEVVITTDQDQTTTSDWALYDVPAQLVTVGGNVVLTQGKNVLKGDRLVIDLKTGESRFENTGNGSTGGKIRALFMPKQDAAAKNGKAGDGQTSKDAKGPSKPAPQDATDDGKPAPQDAADDGASAEQEAPTPLFPGLPH